MSPPTIAVVITNYNYARFLPNALDSVLAQAPPFDEIIVVDDGSTDESLEVLARYLGRITVISISNCGQLGACRVGIMAASSEYVYTLDADDYAAPGLVAKIKSVLADQRPVKVQFQLHWVSEDRTLLGSAFPTYPPGYDAAAMLHDNAAFGFYISPPTSGNVFNREALLRLGIHSFDPSGVIDGSSSLAMPYLGEIISVNEPLAHYRVHGNSMSNWPKPTIPLLRKEIRLFRDMWSEVGTALGLKNPPFARRPLFIHERQMMIACKEYKRFIWPEVWRYVSGIPSTNLRRREKILLITWAMCLLIPSSTLRDYSIRMKRSSANRSRRLQALVNILIRP
jgi:glycosyltransferase involved in cell wall biosynthesis